MHCWGRWCASHAVKGMSGLLQQGESCSAAHLAGLQEGRICSAALPPGRAATKLLQCVIARPHFPTAASTLEDPRQLPLHLPQVCRT